MQLQPDKSLGILCGLLVSLGGYYFGFVFEGRPNVFRGVGINILDPIQVDFTLSERELPRVAVGNPVEVHVAPYPGERFTGEVIALDSSVAPQTRTFRVRARLGNPELRLRPGMFANVVALREQVDEVVTVPRTAISYNTYGDFVFAVVEGDSGLQAERRTVETGRVRDGEVEIVEGLEAGTRVVAAGLLRLRNGQPVRIVEGPGAGGPESG